MSLQLKDWEVQYSKVKLFPTAVLSSISEESSKYLNASNPNSPDEHGLYPLIYSAALANEDVLKSLLPCTNLELVHNALSGHSTSLLNIIIDAPLRKAQKKERVVEEDDTASMECLKAYISLNKLACTKVFMSYNMHIFLKERFPESSIL